MSAELTLLLCVMAPLAQTAAVAATARWSLARDGLNMIGALLHAGLALQLINLVTYRERPFVVLAQPLPGASLAFAAEPVGLTVAALIAVLGALSAIYATGFARAVELPGSGRLMSFSALAIAAASGAALSANLFTFFVCYVALALSSFALISHDASKESARSARVFLGLILFAAVGLLLPAIIWTYALTGTLDFVRGGLLAGRIDALGASVLLALYVFGLALAALPPFHRWLPEAMAAPTPAAGMVCAVAATSTGALGVVKVALFVFGPAMAQARVASQAILILALVSACGAALIALSKQDMKQRLAYSTAAQMGIVIAGAMISAPAAIFAATFQIVAHGVGKFTLFLVAGAVEAVTGRTRADEYVGLGRRMPWAFTAFALASLSIAGAPPLAGAWSTLWLVAGAGEAKLYWAAGLVVLSSLLGFAYLGPLATKALFGAAPEHPFDRPDAASVFLIVPVAVAGAATLLLLFLVDPLSRFVAMSVQ